MNGCVTEFDFTLILTGIDDFDESTIDKLFEAGCDDATVAQRYGRVYVTFSRESASLIEAVVSAIKDIHRAEIGAHVLRVDSCNLVTPAEIARRLNRSRQNIDQYISGKRGTGGFPPPACNITDGNPLYYWCEVAYWASQQGLLSPRASQEAQELATVNAILELRHQREIDPNTADKLIEDFRLCNTCET